MDMINKQYMQCHETHVSLHVNQLYIMVHTNYWVKQVSGISVRKLTQSLGKSEF